MAQPQVSVQIISFHANADGVGLRLSFSLFYSIWKGTKFDAEYLKI